MDTVKDMDWAEELPELYAIDGAVPGELLEEFAKHLDGTRGIPDATLP